MSKYLCTTCLRFHETKEDMKNCKHEDVEVPKEEKKIIKKVIEKSFNKKDKD